MKQFVIVAGTFGASKWTTLKLAFVAQIVEWGNRLSSNTEIQNAYLGKVISTPKPSLAQSMKEKQFYPESGIVGILTASIQNTSKKFNLR